jgi:hypothetical protein
MRRQLLPRIVNTTHYVHSNYQPKTLQKYKGSYATTSLRCLFTNPECDEEHLVRFIDDFKCASERFYNLREFSIHAPYVIMDGSMLSDLIKASSINTEMDLELFAFHTPIPSTWKTCRWKKMQVRFSDGIAYPDSGTDFLRGIEDCGSLKELRIENKSPHRPLIKHSSKVKNKIHAINFSEPMNSWGWQ